MGTDWFVKVECPHPHKEVKNDEERVKVCLSCPYVIWQEPESVAGFMSTMCGVRVGSLGMAAELDSIGQKLTRVERFTKKESCSTLKKQILTEIMAHVKENGWTIQGSSRRQTMEHLKLLIEFCKRAEDKGLAIWAWA